MNSPKSVAVFSAFYLPAFLGGGPIRSLSALVKTAPSQFVPAIISSDTDLGEQIPLPVKNNSWTSHDGVAVYYASASKIQCLVAALKATRGLRPDIIYLSSFFNLRFSILPQLMIAVGYFRPKSVALAPRGEFSSGALGIKGAKKRLYISIYRRCGMAKKVIWHASSSREASDIRRAVGHNVKVVIRENDTDLPVTATAPAYTPQEFIQAVFVGRVVRIKGLLTLLEALKQCTAPLSLDVYGPEEDLNYALECRRRAQELPDHVVVRFLGAFPNDAVRAALPKYDLMMFPTAGENFGHVIAEALSASCPVMCADVTPWTSRIVSGGGIIVKDNTVQGWAAAIEDYATKSPSQRMATREAAGACFDRWRRSSAADHVFSMLLQAEEELKPQG
ncbi:glycosyltransferase family 4 protein [Arthrobacter sp. D1-17]